MKYSLYYAGVNKIRSLHTGSDFTNTAILLSEMRGYRDFGNVGIVTCLIQAHDVLYTHDSERVSKLSAQVDLGKMIKAIKGDAAALAALQGLKMEVGYYHDLVAQIGSQGCTTPVEWSLKPFSWENYTNSISTQLSDSWHTVYAVMTSPKGLLTKRLGEDKETIPANVMNDYRNTGQR